MLKVKIMAKFSDRVVCLRVLDQFPDHETGPQFFQRVWRYASMYAIGFQIWIE